MKTAEQLVYENKWCKVVYLSGYYILKSRQGHYNDQYFRDSQEVSKATGIPVKTMALNNLPETH